MPVLLTCLHSTAPVYQHCVRSWGCHCISTVEYIDFRLNCNTVHSLDNVMTRPAVSQTYTELSTVRYPQK